jgi:hypothetical protein
MMNSTSYDSVPKTRPRSLKSARLDSDNVADDTHGGGGRPRTTPAGLMSAPTAWNPKWFAEIVRSVEGVAQQCVAVELGEQQVPEENPRPAIKRASVVLPEADSPTRPRTSPWWSSNLTSSSISMP